MKYFILTSGQNFIEYFNLLYDLTNDGSNENQQSPV